MATAELINPMHSEDLSPTENRPPQRRTALLRTQLSLDIPTDSRGLSSSLPSPISKKELSFLKAIHQNEKNKRHKFKESSKLKINQSMDAETVEGESERRELSPQDTLSTGQQRMRPRSASLFSGSERGTPKRKSMRGLSRSRPSSAKIGRSRSRADSFKPDETTMEKVESIMANVKTQLTQLSEEDLLLEDRLNKLTEGINILINTHCRKYRPTQLNPIRSVSSGTPRKPGKVVHWKDMEMAEKPTASTSAPSSESEPNLLSPSCNLVPPTVTLSSSSSDTDIILSERREGEKVSGRAPSSWGDSTTHKILKLNGVASCSSASSPPPVCTIVIEEPDGQIHCPTPSSLADDEVFVL